MRPVVDLLEVVPLQRVEAADVTARSLESLQVVALHPARADGIDDEIHAHAATRGLLESNGELVCHCARVINVSLETDAALRVPNRIEHRGEELIPVGEHVVV